MTATALKAGFGKVDITPRVGVELAGFGPYNLRHSIAVRDRLWVRAMALQSGKDTLLIISCDLLGIHTALCDSIRNAVHTQCGVPREAVLLSCSHTHSGPSVRESDSWGTPDPPYIALLPYRILDACRQAIAGLQNATLGIARVPCEGIGVNRIYELDGAGDSLPLDLVLKDDWRPAKPELTDTSCTVLTVHCKERLLGFLANFGCHPVVCCGESRHIHGDFTGVAVNQIEREFPGAVGAFLQGACGDINSCAVHQPEMASLHALDVIAGRFANSLRTAINRPEPIQPDRLSAKTRLAPFSYRSVDPVEIERQISGLEAIVAAAEADQHQRELRMAVMSLQCLRRFSQALSAKHTAVIAPAMELQLMQIGPLVIHAAPVEIYQGIKNDLVAQSSASYPIVASVCNGAMGYAQSRDREGCGDYADTQVPMIHQMLPFSKVHDELLEHFSGGFAPSAENRH